MLLENKTNTVTNIKLKSEPMGLVTLKYKILERKRGSWRFRIGR